MTDLKLIPVITLITNEMVWFDSSPYCTTSLYPITKTLKKSRSPCCYSTELEQHNNNKQYNLRRGCVRNPKEN